MSAEALAILLLAALVLAAGIPILLRRRRSGSAEIAPVHSGPPAPPPPAAPAATPATPATPAPPLPPAPAMSPTAAAREGATPGTHTEPVQFTVYRPSTLVPGNWARLLVYTHLADLPANAPPDTVHPLERVRREAKVLLEQQPQKYVERTQDAQAPIPRASEIRLVPHAPSIDFNPTFRWFNWEEDIHREEFGVRAPSELDGQTVHGCLTVFAGLLPVAKIPLVLRVSSSPTPGDLQEHQAERARRFRKVFASYSHLDAPIVQRVEDTARALNIEFLRDVNILRPGEPWSATLEDSIRQADTFQLFWSTDSMRSENVAREWRYALSLRRPEFITPVYWETPMPRDPAQDLPPEELNRLHFYQLQTVQLASLPVSETPLCAAPAPAPGSGKSAAAPSRRESSRGLPPAVNLVAVLIGLAILSSMLLPAISRSRVDQVAARGIQCMNNTKQLMLATQLYLGDNDDRFPGAFHGEAAKNPDNFLPGGSHQNYRPWAIGWLDWSTSPLNTNSLYLNDARYSKVASYYTSANVLRCPADKFISPTQRAQGWATRVRSISGNIGIGAGNAEDGPWDPTYRHVVKASDLTIPGPSMSWVYVDQHPDSIDDTAFFAPRVGRWIDLPASYHNGASGFAFADGHSEIRKWRATTTTAPVRFGQQLDLITSPGDPDLRWLREHTPRVSEEGD